MCIIPGCDGKPKGRGMCSRHYQEANRRGLLKNKRVSLPNIFEVDGDKVLIKMHDGHGNHSGTAIIDLEDLPKCEKNKWCVDAYGYAVSKDKKMHIVVYGARYLDHVNRNKLDNRKSNLRPATDQQNRYNLGKHPNNKSGYKGVSWFTSRNKWRAVINANKKYVHIGYFDDIKDAALAYNKKAKELHGEFAVLNSVIKRRKCESK